MWIFYLILWNVRRQGTRSSVTLPLPSWREEGTNVAKRTGSVEDYGGINICSCLIRWRAWCILPLLPINKILQIVFRWADWYDYVLCPSLTASRSKYNDYNWQKYNNKCELALVSLAWWRSVLRGSQFFYWSTLNSIRLNSTEWKVIMLIGVFHPTHHHPPQELSKRFHTH